MDDEKKKPSSQGLEIGAVIAIVIAIAVAPIILANVSASSAAFFDRYSYVWDNTVVVLKNITGIIIGVSFPLSLFFLIGIVYCVERLKQVRRKEALMFDVKVEPAYEVAAAADQNLANMWNRVTTHINSENQNDWKQAIIEADLILDDLLTKMGYRGESIGEKLKRVEKGDMETRQDAWDAHKVRNQIAHEVGFTLNHIEAKQTIQSYRKVFEEFYYI